MLATISKHTKSLFVKILVGIIILPFVFWGMGDVFRGGNQNIIATINDEKISTKDFMDYLARLNIPDKERQNLSKNNTLDKILEDYIGRKVIQLEVKNFGIKVNDKSLKNIIINNKLFFKNDKFSRTAYEKFLLENSITAPAYESILVGQEKKRQLLDFLSKGVSTPEFLIKNEFMKENQNKKIKYINLNNFYNTRAPSTQEMKKIYESNIDSFTEVYKNINYIELKPENLMGNNDYNKNFFNKINEIENTILDGKTINEIASENNIKINKMGEINKRKLTFEGSKLEVLNDDVFQKIFLINKTNQSELINVDSKFYAFEILSIVRKNISLDNKEVTNAIKAQFKLKDKFEYNSKIIKDINSGIFNESSMREFAEKNNLKIEDIELKGIKENTIFSEDQIKSIFQIKDGKLNLLTDNKLEKNFLIFSVKTNYEKFKKNSKNYKIYENKANINFTREIYNTYDKSVNTKYEVVLKNKVLDRIKNSF